MNYGTYRAEVLSFAPATGIATVAIRQLFGARPITAKPAVRRQGDIALIDPVVPGDTVYVFFDGGGDETPHWWPTIVVP